MDFEIWKQPRKLFFFEKPTKYFPLMIDDSDGALSFRGKDFFTLLNDVGASSGLSTFSALSFSSSVSILSLLTSESIGNCLTSPFQNLSTTKNKCSFVEHKTHPFLHNVFQTDFKSFC